MSYEGYELRLSIDEYVTLKAAVLGDPVEAKRLADGHLRRERDRGPGMVGMTTSTLTLTDFLLARIADDEAVADYRHMPDCAAVSPAATPCDCGYPARVLAECEAHRAIVALADEATGIDVSLDLNAAVGPRTAPYIGDQILAALAAVYSDHPDYRDEWRP